MTLFAVDQGLNLFVRTVELPDTPNLLSLLPADGGLAWIKGIATDQMGIIGWGEVARSTFNGPERFSRAQRWWTKHRTISIGDASIAFTCIDFYISPRSSIWVFSRLAVNHH